jgi:hypothetical protein
MLSDILIKKLRSLNRPLSQPKRLPTEEEVMAVEKALGVAFHPYYLQFLLQASDIDFGLIEPATATDDTSHTNLVRMAQLAWARVGLPRILLPICEDNGDYFCMNAAGEVIYWSHNGTTDEKWPDLATWIEQVWISRQ